MKIKNNSYIKTVNVNAKVPVNSVHPPIYGTLKNVEMSTTIILKCLLRRAQVFEVFEDGSTLKLNLSNYYTDNTNAVKTTPAIKSAIQQSEQSIPANVVAETDLVEDSDVNTTIDSNEEENSTDEEIESDDEFEDEESDEDEIDDEDTNDVITQQSTNNQHNNQNYNRNKKRKKKH